MQEVLQTDEARISPETLEQLPAPLFAVLDGAHFDDIESELLTLGIKSRSLFLKGGDDDLRRDGPFLVNLKNREIIEAVCRIANHGPCAVFWSCSEGEQVLWRHLRTINEILIPDERLPDNDGSQGRAVQYERVLFRHWDPNVLGAILPLLSRAQFARVLGPASHVCFDSPDYGGWRRARTSENLPRPERGTLRLEPEQMERLKTAMLHSSRLRIARFLKANVPPHFSGVDDEFVWGATLASERSADELGIKTERGRARWAYVMMMSDGKAAGAPEVRNYVRDGGDTPDNRVKSLIQHAVDSLRSGSYASGGRV
ncbi:DUF4123 domain-containing protein [Neorhizobium alkalisoli]|uniref:Uncharacterized protein DUF4123 n=1 Tax=Neorhizobium alkalisoli TaxID=528178 RepID=A0A561QI87_9HYPH|nr:DUF4123 domain-containing protein [Neorhizobium alkalisoli]TWF50077.1 uncharacterized protein DUF4123 [Neorhizobium alkalisoli]